MKKDVEKKFITKNTNVVVKMSPSYMLEEVNNRGLLEHFMPETTCQVTIKKHDSKTDEVTYTYRFVVNGKFFVHSVVFIEPNHQSFVDCEDVGGKFVKQTAQNFDLNKVSKKKEVKQALEYYYDANTLKPKPFAKKWGTKRINVDPVD